MTHRLFSDDVLILSLNFYADPTKWRALRKIQRAVAYGAHTIKTQKASRSTKKHEEACERRAKQQAARKHGKSGIQTTGHDHLRRGNTNRENMNGCNDADVEMEDAAPPSVNPTHGPEPMALDVVLLNRPLSDLMRMDRSQLPQTPRLSKIFNGLGSPSVPRADFVDIQLKGITQDWSVAGSMLTINNSVEMAQSLAAAREYVLPVGDSVHHSFDFQYEDLQFETGQVKADFEGKTYTFEFQYRDPWKWILELVQDPSLAPHFKWYPVEKFLHEHGRNTRIYDEPNTGTLWWSVQDSLPFVLGLPHCFLPLILWLDKGMATKRVRKHPIVGRLANLPSAIRNGSGNGGGVLFGYMINT
ncbi:hypothetical protein DFH08DRAFT_818379 [Mycena albidolilacea]|uniref:Uncharacterized protein n=1 Tax=Mycena albidolilacea TaxID=1033008 RepID=A0AAD6ZGW0_9AGAR|nr:hypothetical protein DFH08DRAFT_818379 [Mycena albidolilacea]